MGSFDVNYFKYLGCVDTMFTHWECIKELQGKQKKVEINLVSVAYPQNRTDLYALTMPTLALFECLFL